MNREQTPIAVEGIPFVAGSGVIAFILDLSGWRIPAIFFFLLTAFIIWFFRNPERDIPQGDGLFIAPADGKIIDISEGFEGRILNERSIKISIFMNLFNVHVNRAPCTGRVVDILYNPGKFMSANLEKASLENEQNAVVVETPAGDRVLFIQIAGLIARRIVCRIKKGDSVEMGQRFGLIRFGSRVDIYLPKSINVRVSMGQKVRGGESILAVFK